VCLVGVLFKRVIMTDVYYDRCEGHFQMPVSMIWCLAGALDRKAIMTDVKYYSVRYDMIVVKGTIRSESSHRTNPEARRLSTHSD
jgi:hypothetical protein